MLFDIFILLVVIFIVGCFITYDFPMYFFGGLVLIGIVLGLIVGYLFFWAKIVIELTALIYCYYTNPGTMTLILSPFWLIGVCVLANKIKHRSKTT